MTNASASPQSRLPDRHRTIIAGMVSVIAFTLIAKAFGAFKEMALAWRYGVGSDMDAYVLVFTLVSWPTTILASVLPALLIPLEARMRQETPAGLAQFRAELLGLGVVLGASLAVLFWLALPPLLGSGILGLPIRTSQLAASMVPIMVWTLVPGVVGTLFAAWAMSGRGHANTLLEGVPAVGILVAVLWFSADASLLWGTLIGVVAQTVFLIGYVGRPFIPGRSLASTGWDRFWPALRIAMLGQVVMSMTGLADQAFAARLDEGSISALGYASRILGLVLGIGATAVYRATLPVFSRSGVHGDSEVRRDAVRWAAVMAILGIVAVAAGWSAAPWVVRALFLRGSFSTGDVQTVTQLLRLGLLQVPLYYASLVLVSMHSSLGNYRLVTLSGFLGLAVKLVVAWPLVRGFGVSGLVVSQAVVYAANTTLFLAWGRNSHRRQHGTAKKS